MSIIKRVTHPASLSFVNLILALGSVPTVALSSSTRKSRIMIPVGICSCQCTIIPERVFNLGGITDQFVRNKWSTSPVSVVFQNGIFNTDRISENIGVYLLDQKLFDFLPVIYRHIICFIDMSVWDPPAEDHLAGDTELLAQILQLGFHLFLDVVQPHL